ncbi:hypothetical protein WJX74_008587 [Apatococcus lobatus]|uniref:URB1 N-terminal domain-containing protein n=1 Tax=Apatococcus lobatus TaxID=904363 RepID=A0AAW1RT50_9CHLO
MALELAVSSLAAKILSQLHSCSLKTALSDVFKALQAPDRNATAQALLSESSDCHELLGLWDTQQKASQPNVGTMLMAIIALLLRSDAPPPFSAQASSQKASKQSDMHTAAASAPKSTLAEPEAEVHDANAPGVPSTLIAEDVALELHETEQPSLQQQQQRTSHSRDVRLDLLALAIISDKKRRRFIEQALGSSAKDRPAAAASLLAAMAARTGAVAHQLVLEFNWGLKALPALARPPRLLEGVPRQEQQTRFWGNWRQTAPLKRPVCAHLVDMGQSLLRLRDEGLLATVLQIRPVMNALLHSMTRQPPEVALRTLRLLQSRIMAPACALSPLQRSQVFTEAFLAQLSSMAAQLVPQGSNRWGDAPRRHVVEAAHDILIPIGSSPTHGMCTIEPGRGSGIHVEGSWAGFMAPLQSDEPASPDGQSVEGGSTKMLKEARQRMLECLLRLRVTEVRAHAQILTSICQTQPAFAVDYLARAPLILEPELSARWFAATSILGQIISAAALDHSGLIGPTLDSTSSRICPGCVTKSQLSRGLQHSSLLVRYATLCLLSSIMKAFQSTLEALQQAGQSLNTPAEGAWPWAGKLCQALRPRLPDVQTLIAMQATLDGLTKTDSAAEEPPQDGSPEDQPQGQLLTNKELLLMRLLDALAGYQRCLPEATGTSTYDALRFLPQDPSELSPVCQLALLDLIEAQSASTQLPNSLPASRSAALAQPMHFSSNSFGPGWKPPPAVATSVQPQSATPAAAAAPTTTSHLMSAHPAAAAANASAFPRISATPTPAAPPPSTLPSNLLKLVVQASVPEVAVKAQKVLRARLRSLLGLEDAHDSEPDLWLQHLPRSRGKGKWSDGANKWTDAIVSFLSEASAAVARRPEQFWETQLSLSADSPAASCGPQTAPGQAGQSFSLLGVSALQQALKVASSSKRPSFSRAAVCSYVAGVLMALIDIQTLRAPLCQLVIGLISAAAAQSSAVSAADSDATGVASGQLPSEAQPLLRLLAHATACLSAQVQVRAMPGTADKAPAQSPSCRTAATKQPSAHKTPRHPLQKHKRKREPTKQASPLSRREHGSDHVAGDDSGSLEEGLNKKLKLAPSIEIQCTDGPWASELQELADHIASTGWLQQHAACRRQPQAKPFSK